MSDAEDDLYGTMDTAYDWTGVDSDPWLARQTKETNVLTKEELLAQREQLAARLSALDSKIESREVYGPDPFKNGDFLKIMITFKGGPGSYTYACTKQRGKFYLTGRVQSTRTFLGADDTAVKNGWTYDQLVSWFATAEGVDVWRVTKLEKVL